MNPMDEDDARQAASVATQRRQKVRRVEFAKAVQTMLVDADARLVLHTFLTEAGIDLTPFRSETAAMAHAVGWQDAARWWLDVLRQHCPEREAQMRNEARSRDKQELTDDDDE